MDKHHPIFGSNVHTSPQSIAAYAKRYANAIQKFGTDDAVAADLIAREKQLSKSSVRQYRAAYSHAWAKLGRRDLIEAVSGLVGEKQSVARGSAKKAKAFRWVDMLRLLGELERVDERLAAAWLRATYITGLRPSEWRYVRLSGQMLVVKNGKASNGRSHGEERAISVQLKGEIKNIGLLIYNLRINYDEHYRHTRYVISAAAERLWPGRDKRPSLYTARHMFSAEAKRAMSKEEVAALLGHASDRTAGMHYARATSASGNFGVKPSANDVAAVRKSAAATKKNPGLGQAPGFWM